MSLTVRHLNGDTTFLLTFAPLEQQLPSPPISGCYHAPGTFTVLLDPWLAGSSSMWHPKFLLSRHTTPSCIDDLSQIPEPNVVLISQVKPDHCHEATLRQLDPTSPITTILAEPAAAKKIRSMKHFNPAMVHSLRPYSGRKADSVIRFCIPATVPNGIPGEATISFMPAKLDVAGVHNAIGITYRPPSTSPSVQSRPFTPSMPDRTQAWSSNDRYPSTNLPITPPDSPLGLSTSYASSSLNASPRPSDTFSTPQHSHSASSLSSFSSTATQARHPVGKALSLIYSPHGVDYNLLRSYASTHLVRSAALPLTLLLHSFDRVSNPWWMGGNVATGLPGGVEIAKNLMARCWISAHDEDKDNTGISVANVKTRKYNLDEVERMVDRATKIVNLGVGEDLSLTAI
ncbi:MAG: hypothetical protein OHK93_000996 [Ramalina farinacea]|uniref:Uncharacterized protein n=1 Tax=Ramalina farinacea TaxID=258253 RepID=A0AA43TVR1_9LECA|nr:hypothetical protein [Ramalina farinacea]